MGPTLVLWATLHRLGRRSPGVSTRGDGDHRIAAGKHHAGSTEVKPPMRAKAFGAILSSPLNR